MANKTITDYTAAGSIDAAADYYLIEQGGLYKKINRNVGLGLSSAPLGTSDSQSPTNKTFDNTNTLTVKAANLTIQDGSDTSKQAKFIASGITTGNTRSFTFPDASGTLVTTAGTQTLTNKTITSPTLTGGTIDNSTVTVDSISGHSSATVVTVANLQISNGVLNTANAVTATSVADGAIEPKALITGTGTGWAWASWTPTWTNLTVGNGTLTANYIQIGKTVFFRIVFILGSTSSVSTPPQFSLPVATNSGYVSQQYVCGFNYFSGAAVFEGQGKWQDSTHLQLEVVNATGSYGQIADVSSTVPFTWATSYQILGQGFYEAA